MSDVDDLKRAIGTDTGVLVTQTSDVDDLKRTIWKEGERLSFKNIDPKDLVLYQVGVVYD